MWCTFFIFFFFFLGAGGRYEARDSMDGLRSEIKCDIKNHATKFGLGSLPPPLTDTLQLAILSSIVCVCSSHVVRLQCIDERGANTRTRSRNSVPGT